ncbi:MAG: SAM-dependent methyltransferase [Planctomycetaceae bacterium]|nr:SAM-dependent methyltransferase [Planctomycetaceae bacterium]
MSAPLPAWPDYALVDFGDGRRLERFGEWLLDRPCPAAVGVAKAQPATVWKAAAARYDGDRADDGTWRPAAAKWPQQEIALTVPLGEDGDFALTLEPLPSGQVGVFAEQFANWQWIAAQVRRLVGSSSVPRLGEPGEAPDDDARQHGSQNRGTHSGPKVLNLFGYTGGSTLAAAAAGAQVVHVDAARSVVARARKNAAASGLGDAPIRWIVEDAAKFCRREAKRGNRYDAVILDPPSFGHGPKGEQWRANRDLLPLVELCGELLDGRPQFLLATCHTPGIDQSALSAMLAEGVFGHCGQPAATSELELTDQAGRKLPSGVAARWPR